MKTIILKLGGGILTYKRSSRPQPRTDVIIRIAKELMYAYKRKPYFKLILLYGVGSFGHHLVWKHKLLNRWLTNSSMVHVGEVINSVRELGSLISKICLNTGLSVIPLQTSSLVQLKNKKFIIKNLSVIETILKYRGIPLFGGDMVLSQDNLSYVASADELAVLLSKYFENSKVLFATDVDGVYKSFPPQKGEGPLKILNRSSVQKMIKSRFSATKVKKHDVTGEMIGKLKRVLGLRNRKIVIFNGQEPSLIARALLSKNAVGTTILL